MKIVTIGGGSSYTPELMEGFIKRYNELPIKEIWLVDIEQGKEKVNIDAKMSQRMWDAAGYDVKVHVSFDRREALKDADFVTTQFRVGLLEARIKDERIPLSYGMLGQETNGAGGIFKAFRTIPVILDIVEDMKELCPNAWLINFTNPSGMVTEAVIKYGKWDRCIGLCNVPTIAMMKEPIALNVDPNELIYQFVGLNHFHWHKVYDKDGNDLMPQIKEHVAVNGFADALSETNQHVDDSWRETFTKVKDVYAVDPDTIPNTYLKYYLYPDYVVEHSNPEYTRANEVMDGREKHVFGICNEIIEKGTCKGVEGFEADAHATYIVDLACALAENTNERFLLIVPNEGAIENFDRTAMVEIPCIVGRNGYEKICQGSIPQFQKGLMEQQVSVEKLTVEAWIEGDYTKLWQAITLSKTVPSARVAKLILDDLIEANKDYWPALTRKEEKQLELV